MSAYVVTTKHINALINHIANTELSYYGFTSTLEIGRELLRENIAGVCDRYSDMTPETAQQDFSGETGFSFALVTVPALHALSLLSGYEYQACESSNWETSKARAICDRLRSTLIRKLPGYSDAPRSL